MKPRLIALAGPLQGNVFPLDEKEFVIGRDIDCTIRIHDASVSRKHCCVRQDQDNFWLIDLGSFNGTFLNDLPVKKKEIREGDRIEVGGSLFLFLVEEQEKERPATEEPQAAESDQWLPRTTMELKIQDAVHSQSEKVLDVLFKISNYIYSVHDPALLQRKILELILEISPADRAAILLADPHSNDLTFSEIIDRKPAGGTFAISKTIARRVLQERLAILSNDVQNTASIELSSSLYEARINSILVVPLLIFDHAIGVIHLDTCTPGAIFQEEHLHLLSVVAGMAAVALENAQHVAGLKSENQRLWESLKQDRPIVGESPPIQEVLQKIARVAPLDSTVLIYGESGTGKELAAHALHSNSRRSQRPFVVVNCIAIAENLLENELFGHEKGAFTGALSQKKGKLEIADGGTVFFDEIGDLAPHIQGKLLRVLQEREFDRVGGTKPISVDVRFVAATSRNLGEAVRNHQFRSDLYYRLNVVNVTLPPLRSRREDIPLLVNYFMTKYARRCGRMIHGISGEALECLLHYPWPGNIRELENTIEAALVMGTTELILPEDLPERILDHRSAVTLSTNYSEAVTEAKKKIVLRALEKAKGNVGEAAGNLGLHPNNLQRLIRNLGLRDAQK